MTDNVIRADFGGAPFPLLADMYEAVWDTVMEFGGQVPTLGAIGVLRLIEHKLLAEGLGILEQDDD